MDCCVRRTTQREGPPGAALLLAATLIALFAGPAVASGFEAFDGRLQGHGFYRLETRVISKNYSPGGDWYLSQLAHTLNLEIEADLLDEPVGPIDQIGLFSRIEVRFECIWADGCAIFNSRKYFGEDHRSRNVRRMAELGGRGTELHAPTDTLTDGLGDRRTGVIFFGEKEPAHRGNELIPFFTAPAFEPLFDIAGEALALQNIQTILGDTVSAIPLVAIRKIDGAFEQENFTLGPYNRNASVQSLATLRSVDSTVNDFPLRPALPAGNSALDPDDPDEIQGLWAPHFRLRERIDDIDDDGNGFNLSEGDLAWNHGAGQQDEKELKELYLDIEMFQGRLWLRLGKQTIVWGKTELFRNQDQFNPQDVGLSSLPSLEESRLALWAVRGVWSFYDVGPLEDVRLELAAIIDDFQPIDAGTCGEPYAPFLVCAGSFGLFAHGLTGTGLAGVELPPAPWNDSSGWEVGARLEWRYGRFSFALTDFWGYSDTPYLERFVGFERKVDPLTGRPLDALGRPYDFSDPARVREQALDFQPLNRTLFEFACALSVGVGEEIITSPTLADQCALALFSNDELLGMVIPGLAINLGIATLVGLVLAGDPFGSILIPFLGGSAAATLISLNPDVNDGPAPPPGDLRVLDSHLTDEQEALLGCGPFYGSKCVGFDIFLAEGSALFQAFPQFEPEGPVATRFYNGQLLILPGARGPGDPGYDPAVDGCVGPLPVSQDPGGLCAGSMPLINPRTGQRFGSEMEALSFNLVELLTAFGTNFDPTCDPADPITCSFVRGFFGTVGVGRPDIRAGGNGRFGRRDFLWAGGGQATLAFKKRNVLGFAMDFAEDWSKTNWSIEATWVRRERIGDNDSPTLFRDADIYNLTVSLDRPTFVNFLNANRTFIFNTQVFVQYVSQEGPVDLLGTFTIFTGYFQDRLVSQLTFVHDLRSASGGVIFNLTYRFSSAFSTTLGLAGFYGGPANSRTALFPLSLDNRGGDYKQRSSFPGLSILGDRDEISLQFRYTF